MKFIFHIGCSKTGSSALQHDLAKNYNRLKECGILYPKYLMNKVLSQHWEFASLSDLDQLPAIINKYYELGIENNCSTIVISSERFCYCSEDFVKSLAKSLAKFEVKIIFYARNQGDILLSSFLHTLKTGKNTETDFTTYCLNVYKQFNYNKRIINWCDSFLIKNTLVFSYHENDLRKKDITSHFIGNALNNISVNLDKSKIRINKSLSPKFLPVVKMLYDNKKLEKKFRTDLLKELSKYGFEDTNLKRKLINQIPKQIQSYYKKANFRFNKQFLLPSENRIKFN